MYKYFPHTTEDTNQMLDKIGIKSLDDLYADVPECIRFRKEYNLPEELSEVEIRQMFKDLAQACNPLKVFAGAGVYDHLSNDSLQPTMPMIYSINICKRESTILNPASKH